MSYSPWGQKESGTTEWLTHTHKDGGTQSTTKGSWAAPTAQATEWLRTTPSSFNVLLNLKN